MGLLRYVVWPLQYTHTHTNNTVQLTYMYVISETFYVVTFTTGRESRHDNYVGTYLVLPNMYCMYLAT